MKLTLRKSDAVQKLIQEALSSTDLETTTAITRFNNPNQVVVEARDRFDEALGKKIALWKAYYALRKATAAQNAETLVDDILADVALIDKQIALLKPLAAIKEFTPETDVLKAQQEDLRSERTEKYTRRESVAVSLINGHDVERFTVRLAELRRQKQTFSDKLLELNVQNTIEVEPDVETILRTYDII